MYRSTPVDSNLKTGRSIPQQNTGECAFARIRSYGAAVRGKLAMLVMVLAFVAVGMAPAGHVQAAQISTSAAAAPASTIASASWVDLMMAMLREVIILLGGDPNAIDPDDIDQAMADFRAEYARVGIPAGMSADEQQVLLGKVKSADDTLGNAGTNASSGQVSQTHNALTEIRARVTAAPIVGSRP